MVGEELIGVTDPAAAAGIMAALGAFFVVFLILGIAIYIFCALAFMSIAKKTNTPNGWLAFIPIANVYLMTQIAGVSGWWTLIIFAAFIPFIGGLAVAAAMVYFLWLICEKVGKPGWWSLLIYLIPIVNLVMLGILAWGKR